MKYRLNNITIELTDEDVVNIVKQFQTPTKKRKYFVPKVDKTYWYIDGCDDISENTFLEHGSHKNYKSGNCFATEQDAQDELNRRQSLVRIWNNYDNKYAWDIDWSDTNKRKYGIDYNHQAKEISKDFSNIFQMNTELPYFKSAEDRNQFVEDNRDDLLTVFNIKK